MSSPTFEQITRLLHVQNPYESFDPSPYPLDLHGWNGSESLFRQLVQDFKPKLMIEVGSWMGRSAAVFADELRKLPHPAGLVCVDTWLGAGEFWSSGEEQERSWWSDAGTYFREGAEHYNALELRNGYPQVYYRFLANMAHLGLDPFVTPFPQTSLIAARWFAHHSVKADMIYIDASHEYEDVVHDLFHYYPLVRDGGVLFGDDVPIADVIRAVEYFCQETGLHHQVSDDGVCWMIHKPRRR